MIEVVAKSQCASLVAQSAGGRMSMNPNEGLGLLGWVCLAAVALGVVMTLLFGFTSTFYIAILLVPVVFVALLLLCRGRVPV
jgi:hypothetical protein